MDSKITSINDISAIQAELEARFMNKPVDAVRESEANADISFALLDEWEISGVKLPAPSIGVIMLLQAVKSPFISDNSDKETGLREIMETLFILRYRELLAPMIFKSNEQTLLMKRAEKIAEKSPEMFKTYLNHISECGNPEYELLLTRFIDSVGSVNLPDTVAKLTEYVSKSIQAFSMLPSAGGNSKKKLLPTGCSGLLQMFRKLATTLPKK